MFRIEDDEELEAMATGKSRVKGPLPGGTPAKAYADFLGRLAGMSALRGSVEPRAGFADAVMERVRGKSSVKPVLRRFVPAFAAGAACLLVGMVVGARWMNSKHSDWAEAKFMFSAPGAEIVEVAGDFTDWERVRMTRHNGEWTATIQVPHEGQFQYVFVVNRKVLVVDPRGDEVEIDASGNAYSVLNASQI